MVPGRSLVSIAGCCGMQAPTPRGPSRWEVWGVKVRIRVGVKVRVRVGSRGQGTR